MSWLASQTSYAPVTCLLAVVEDAQEMDMTITALEKEFCGKSCTDVARLQDQ